MKPIIQTLILFLVIMELILLSNCTGWNNDYDKRKIRSWQIRQLATQDANEIMNLDNDVYRLNALIQKIVHNNKKVTWTEDDNDYWRTYEETVENGYRGDCEDISIYWYILLRNTGQINDNDMFIRVIDSTIGPGFHSVLVIYTDQDYPIIIDNGKLKDSRDDKYQHIECEANLFTIY